MITSFISFHWHPLVIVHGTEKVKGRYNGTVQNLQRSRWAPFIIKGSSYPKIMGLRWVPKNHSGGEDLFCAVSNFNPKGQWKSSKGVWVKFPGWHGGAVVSEVASHLQGPGFDSDLGCCLGGVCTFYLGAPASQRCAGKLIVCWKWPLITGKWQKNQRGVDFVSEINLQGHRKIGEGEWDWWNSFGVGQCGPMGRIVSCVIASH